jgi:preprotein translocase subunit SecF
MNKLSMTKFLVFVMVFSFSVTLCEAQKQGRGLFSKSPNKKKTVKVKGPVTVKASKKKQEANDKKLKKEYSQYVKKNQKRSIEIQTSEVQDRMKQNIKDSDSRYKAKKKNNSARTRKAGKKYK